MLSDKNNKHQLLHLDAVNIAKKEKKYDIYQKERNRRHTMGHQLHATSPARHDEHDWRRQQTWKSGSLVSKGLLRPISDR
jgi:hypothetical protein